MNLKLEREDMPSFFKLYPEHDLLLFLIEKELHDTKMRLGLEQLGFSNEYLFVHDLGDLILSLVGIKGRSDELWSWYHELIKAYAQKLEIGNYDAAFEQSCKVYFELKDKKN